MNFDKSVHGISLAAASASNFTLNFSDFSSIIDLDATNPFGAMTVAAGMTLTMVGINQAIPTFEVNLTSSGDISSVTSLTSVIGAINPTTGALTASIPSTATIPALPILETTPPVISWAH